MYVRDTHQKRADGTTLAHIQLVESVWNKVKKRTETRVVYDLGRADSTATIDRLRKLANTLLRRCGLEEVAQASGMKLEFAWPFGDLYVLEKIWKRLGFPEVIERLQEGRRLEFSLERALFTMVANRACAPVSKLGCHEEWLAEDVHIEGTEKLGLHHLYRAMDFLEENQEAIERNLFDNLSNLFNLDVQVVFYDTTSVWFETDEEDEPEKKTPPVAAADAGSGNTPQVAAAAVAAAPAETEGPIPSPRALEGTIPVAASDPGSGGTTQVAAAAVAAAPAETEGPIPPPRALEGAIRKRGNSKDGHGGDPQLVIGLVVTRDGFPVRHWVFPGNTVDVETVARVRADLKDWRLTRCVFVGDAGMVSSENLDKLAVSGGKYVVCVSTGGDDEVARQVIEHPGRFRDVAENLRVKEVTIGDGERRRRYILCYNPQEAERQKKHRDQIVAELEAELVNLRYDEGAEGPTRRICALRASRRYGRYLRFKGRKLELNRARIKEAERRDGKFVLLTNDDTLTPEDLALAYKQLARVEDAWRTLKSGIRLRPVYHHAEHRMRAHVFLCVLALLLERVIEHACQDTWRNIQADLKRIQLGQLSGPQGTILQVTEPRPEARKRLEKLGIERPPEVLRMV
jgi:hypothetical protein